MYTLDIIQLAKGAVHKCQHVHKCTKHILSGGGVCENQHFELIFIIFMGIFGTQKMLMCTPFFGGGGLRKCTVCILMKILTFMDGP